MTMETCAKLLRTHGFVPLALSIGAADLVLASTDPWSDPALLEAGILFDLSVVLPVLYWWCYRTRGRVALLKAVGLGCLGIWVAGHVVPDQHHDLISTVGFARYVGLAVLLLIEIRLVAAIYRAAFSRTGTADDARATAKETGMPEWAARVMAWEASLWRRGWDAVQRLVKRS